MYRDNMTLHLLQMWGLKRQNPDLNRFIVNNLELLDEERGEVSLAQLRESTLRWSDQTDGTVLDMNYKLLPKVREICDDMSSGVCHSLSPTLSLTLSPTLSLTLSLPLCLSLSLSHSVSHSLSPTLSLSLCLFVFFVNCTLTLDYPS